MFDMHANANANVMHGAKEKKEICLGKQLWQGADRCINP